MTADVVDEVMALVGVNGWTRDEWVGERGLYFGSATAGSDYDTFEQLAKNITGKAGDAFSLRATNPQIDHIEVGTEVDISKLLEILEERLRENVVEAALADKAAGFGGNSSMAIGEKAINRIFSGGSSSGWEPSFDCYGMVAVEFARGVMMELMPGEFDALGFNPAHFWAKDETLYFNGYGYNPIVPLEELMPGDYAYFHNNSNYLNVHPGEAWSGEATIVINSTSYIGWPFRTPMTYEEWVWELMEAYNEDLWPWEKIGIGDVPGYLGGAGFIDVAKLAMTLFDYRETN